MSKANMEVVTCRCGKVHFLVFTRELLQCSCGEFMAAGYDKYGHVPREAALESLEMTALNYGLRCDDFYVPYEDISR